LGQAAAGYISWGERVSAARTLNELGVLEADDENLFHAAIGTFRKSLALESHNEHAETDAQGNICILEFLVGDYDKSLDSCSAVLHKAGPGFRDFWKGRGLLEIARIYEVQNKTSEAKEYFSRARIVCSQDGDKLCEDSATSQLAKLQAPPNKN
jgi:tetratricopeptide (TPR) repeat protein